MKLVQSFDGTNEHFDVLCDCAKHPLQYRTFTRPSDDSIMTAVGSELDIDMTPSSFIAAASTPFPRYDCLGHVLL